MCEVGVNFLRKMSRKKLNAYVSNLQSVIKKETDEKNIKLFEKWLEDAYNEIKYRQERKDLFLKRNNIF